MRPQVRAPALVLACAMACLIACASPLAVNRDYQRPKSGTPALAIIPILADASGASDGAFTTAFAESRDRCRLVPMSPLRDRIAHDPRLAEHLLMVLKEAEKKGDLARAEKLQDILGKKNLTDLRLALEMADMMLLVPALRMDELNHAMSGTMGYRLYDLRDGSSVFRNEATFTVDVTGEPGATALFFLMTQAAREDVERYFLRGPAL